MKKISFKQYSLMTAIKTPYQQSGNIDFDSYDKLVQRQIDAKVEGLIVCGTTGEGHLMNWTENLSLLRHTLVNFGKKITVIGNTGSNCTKEALQATKEAVAIGTHACLQLNPYYGKTSKLGLLKHFLLLLDLAPCIIYNVPSRTAQDIEPDTIAEISKHTNFVGVKECTGNKRIKSYEAQGIACWSGNDDQAFDAKHQCGARGVISVAANIIPKLFRTLMDEDNHNLFQKCLPLIKNLFCEPNPIATNTLLAMMGLCQPVFRLPYFPLPIIKQKQLIKNLRALGFCETIKTIAPEKFKLIY